MFGASPDLGSLQIPSPSPNSDPLLPEISAFSSAELVQSAQRQIDHEIQEYQESIRALRSRRNGLSSIGRLPPEMLSRVFQFCALPDSLSWIEEVSHICRHWRAVALGCPNLWCSPIFSRPKWADEMLKRSKMAPLSIRLDLDVTFITPRMLEAVHSSLGHISRVAELEFAGHSIESSSIQAILNLTDPAPYLHSLSLSAHNRERFAIPAAFLNGEAPRLRKIELTRFSIPWDSPLMNNLVHLKIHDSDATGRPSSINELVEALGRMPLLEILELENALPTIAEGVTTVSVPSMRTSLPHLKHIVIASRFSVLEVANTLNHLSHPPTTSMRISCQGFGTNSAEFTCTTLMPALSSLQSAPTISLRSLCVDVNIGYGGVNLRAWTSYFRPSDLPPHNRPFLDLEIKYCRQDETELLLGYMCKSLPLQGLQSLSVSDAIETRTWLSSFADLPALQTVRLRGQASQLIAALREDVFLDGVKQTPRARAVKPAGHGRKAGLRKPRQENVSGGLFFPALRHLTLQNTDFEHEVLDTLERALMERCERKQDLWSLTLSECFLLGSNDVLRLQEIVPEVIWDEIEQGFSEDEDEYYDYSEDTIPLEFIGYGYDTADYDGVW
ncbi:hypothetical protein C8F04DRAFT_724165 [Mycena alexandri]|uniref:F-box domain-containing protein n=1 Tax=Mycena alexandri TaxID=1745969 RepID=A0AAD6TEG3_9AGAR|nr:hypothetical protein C8F04DRAFT_724165 [Mycena alexandri]